MFELKKMMLDDRHDGIEVTYVIGAVEISPMYLFETKQ